MKGRRIARSYTISKYAEPLPMMIPALNSVVGLYYYFKVVKAMFLMTPEEGADTSPIHLHWLQYVVLAVLAIPTLALGLFFGEFKALADTAISLMSGM